MNLTEAKQLLKENNYIVEGLDLSADEYRQITTYWIKKLGGLTQEEAEALAASYAEDIYANYDAEIAAHETAQEILDSEK